MQVSSQNVLTQVVDIMHNIERDELLVTYSIYAAICCSCNQCACRPDVKYLVSHLLLSQFNQPVVNWYEHYDKKTVIFL